MKRIKVLIICMLYLVSIMLGVVSCAMPSSGIKDDSIVEPIGFGPEPTITVFTEFPEGTVIEQRVDITYEAIPSEGAYITQISYSINGEMMDFVYLANTSNPQYDKFGKGYIHLAPEENEIVFTVGDSSGKIGQFAVTNKPYWDTGYEPEIDYSKFLPAKEGEDRKYLPDMLFLYVKSGVSYEEVEEIIASIDGEVVGWRFGAIYYIQVPESTEEELEVMCAKLEKKHKKKISYVGLYYIFLNSYSGNGPQ